MRQQIASWYDISEANHALHPDIMRGFVKTFDKPVDVMGYDLDGNRVVLAKITAIDTPDGRSLFGEVEWSDGPIAEPRNFVKINWWSGARGVGVSSGFVDVYPHRTETDAWDEVDEDDPPSSDYEICGPDSDEFDHAHTSHVD